MWFDDRERKSNDRRNAVRPADRRPGGQCLHKIRVGGLAIFAINPSGPIIAAVL